MTSLVRETMVSQRVLDHVEHELLGGPPRPPHYAEGVRDALDAVAAADGLEASGEVESLPATPSGLEAVADWLEDVADELAASVSRQPSTERHIDLATLERLTATSDVLRIAATQLLHREIEQRAGTPGSDLARRANWLAALSITVGSNPTPEALGHLAEAAGQDPAALDRAIEKLRSAELPDETLSGALAVLTEVRETDRV